MSRPAVWCLLVALAASGCGGHGADATAGRDPDVLLVADGDIVIRKADIAPFDDYFEALDATMGRKYRTRELLQQHLIPLMLARRAFATERAAMRQRAADLRAVASNSLELTRKGALAGGAEPEHPLTRNELDLPVAAWAFRPEHLGAVSPPIETARGYVLIAPLDLSPGVTPVSDQLRAFVVEFPTHDRETFDAWLGTARLALTGRVDHVAPELEGALPPWLED